MNGLELSRPRDTTALVRDALRAYRGSAGTFLLVSAAIVLPADLVVFGLGLDQLTGPYNDRPSAAETIVPAAVSLLVVGPLITAACIYALRDLSAGIRPRTGRVLTAGLEAFTPIFFAVVLMAIGIGVGLLLLILPGIYLTFRWWFVPQAVVLENARGLAVLAASSRVVEGFWWRTFGVVVLANLAGAIPSLLLVEPFAAIARSSDRAIWSLLGQMAAQIATAPFIALVSTLLYYDLRARRTPGP